MIRKRAVIFAILILMCIMFVSAAPPRLLTVQGRLKSNGLLANGDYNMVFSIYDVATGGTPLWQETHYNVSVTNGYFSVILGESTPLALDFNEQYWLGIKVNDDNEMTPRVKLTNASYAFYALDANVSSSQSLWSDAGNYIYPNNYGSFVITDDGNVGIGTTAPGSKLTLNGSIEIIESDPVIFVTNNLDAAKEVLSTGSTASDVTFVGTWLAANPEEMIMGSFDPSGGNFWGMRRTGAYRGEIGLSYDPLNTTNGFVNGGTGLVITDGDIEIWSYGNFVAEFNDGIYLDLRDWNTGNVTIRFYAYDSPTAYSYINVGKFGLGDTTPDARLEIVKPASGDILYISSTATGDGDIFTVKSTGRVGIGVIDPVYKLDVAGGARFSSDIYVGLNKVWHEGNDGPGSGLDADTVDGYHASSFLGSTCTIRSASISTEGPAKVLSVSCQTGETLVGGGCKDWCTQCTQSYFSSYPSGNSWVCSGYVYGRTAYTYAICCTK